MASTGVPCFVLARILNHTHGGVTAVCDRHSSDAEKRAALEAWAGRLLQRVGEPVIEAGRAGADAAWFSRVPAGVRRTTSWGRLAWPNGPTTRISIGTRSADGIRCRVNSPVDARRRSLGQAAALDRGGGCRAALRQVGQRPAPSRPAPGRTSGVRRERRRSASTASWRARWRAGWTTVVHMADALLRSSRFLCYNVVMIHPQFEASRLCSCLRCSHVWATRRQRGEYRRPIACPRCQARDYDTTEPRIDRRLREHRHLRTGSQATPNVRP